jgi:5-methylcytosine-specific restriction endonuclease McrA
MKSKTGLMRKADRLFSIHLRGKFKKCQHCGSTRALNAAHIISRDCRKLRYSEINVLCLCAACHFFFHKHPLQFAEWVKKLKGRGTYKKLIKESNELQPVDRTFYEKVIHRLEKRDA